MHDWLLGLVYFLALYFTPILVVMLGSFLYRKGSGRS